MKINQSFFLSLILVCILFPTLSFAETMYAKRGGTKVTAAPSPTSKVVGTLNVGDRVQVLKKDGRKYQVKLSNGRTGWVFKFKLTASKPAGKSKGGSGLSALTGRSTIAAREARAGGSIRGLKETTANYAKGKHIDPAHQRAVDDMEARVVTIAELAAFQREGGLGEYSGGAQ
ncbi:MAG: SH3 domain-containing protein [Nitrospirota bacterium]|nr:SH3 domain-containing protein [Nitrospirota bacterium]